MNKRINLFTKVFALTMLWACSTEITQEEEISKNQTKKIHFKGLEVNHRFPMPAAYFDDEQEIELMPAAVHNNAYSLTDYALEDIAEVAKKVFKRYPYPSEDKNFTTDFAMIKKIFQISTKKNCRKRFYY